MVPWVQRPTIEIDLGLPPVERFQSIPDEAAAAGSRLLQAIKREMPPGILFMADAIRMRTDNRFQEEARLLAQRFGEDWRDVMIANVSYDLALAAVGCSTVALPTACGPVLARNMDWWPEDILAQTTYLISASNQGRLVYAHAGWPGAIGVVSGLSSNGFAVALNAVVGPDGPHKTGYPVLLHSRRVLEKARGFSHAVDLLSRQTLATSCLFVVVGSENDERVVIERSPTRSVQRWAAVNEPLVATNDYRAMYEPESSDDAEIYKTTCLRYETLTACFGEHSINDLVDDAELLYHLTEPSVLQTITAQHVIMRPREQYMSVYVPRQLLAA